MKNNIQKLLTLLLLSIICTQLSCTGLQKTIPTSVGMSPERLSRIDNHVHEYISKNKIPGAVIGIMRHGRLVYLKSYGQRDIDDNLPMEEDTIFRIASMTKAVTSTALMMLYEEGKFLLDDPLYQYIPEFKDPVILDQFNETDGSYSTLPAKKQITIRQLLNHTSGIGYGINRGHIKVIYDQAGIYDGNVKDNLTIGESVKKLAKLPLLFEPGEKWNYGLNIDVVGYLIEVLSGKSLADFFQHRIFDPLGMEDTYFYLPEEKVDRLASLYAEVEEGVIKEYPVDTATRNSFTANTDYPIAGAKTYYSGGAGLVSTATDYLAFLQMYLNKGKYNGQRLLSRKTVELILTNQLVSAKRPAHRYFGLGFGLNTEATTYKTPASVGKFEWGGIFFTNYWADPREDIAFVGMAQVYPNIKNDFYNKLEVLVYQAVAD